MQPDALWLDVRLGGLLGDALAANKAGRLFHFIDSERSPAIALFDRAVAALNFEGDWYGEHAGKWLAAAAKAAARTHDAALTANVRRVADHLLAQQEPDGYLGTYAPQRRFMVAQPPKPGSWDGAPSVRTWDIWVHSYLILGLLEVHRLFGAEPSPDTRYRDAARRIGDLCIATLERGGIDITDLGNHHGLSATVLLDPAMALHAATGDERYLNLARRVLAQANAAPALALVPRALAGADAADIATGKAYQLIWNLVGFAKLHAVDPVAAPRAVLDSLWTSIREQHLTLGGGPWGGVAHRSREVFNAPGSFDPQAYVETCSTLAWMQLNRELLAITDDPRFADDIERSAYNDLLGAMAPNGEDWCYYVFPNGRRVHTTYWRCCKSSGALAVEELPRAAYRITPGGVLTVDLYGPGSVSFEHPVAGTVVLTQATCYPFDGAVQLHLQCQRPARFAIRLRIPPWATGATLRVVGAGAASAVDAGTYATIDREWRDADAVDVDLPMRPALHNRAKHNVQESRAPGGAVVRQQVLHQAYIAITRGPLAYATRLVDGYKTDETVRLPDGPESGWLQTVVPEADPSDGGRIDGRTDDSDGAVGADEGPAIRLSPVGREPIDFVPYYRAGDGGRVDGAWRLTWLSLAPQQ